MKNQEILDQIKNFNFPEKITGCGASLSTHYQMEICLPDGTPIHEVSDIIKEIRKLNNCLMIGSHAIGYTEQGEKTSITITWCGHEFPDDMVCHCDDCQDTK